MVNTNKVGVLSNKPTILCGHYVMERALEGLGLQYPIDVDWFEYASEARKAFSSSPYDLIVTELIVAGGVTEDPEIKKLVQLSYEERWRIGAYAIEGARGEESPNRDTPIIIATVMHRVSVPADLKKMVERKGFEWLELPATLDKFIALAGSHLNR